jgi:hypothetical protein
LAGMDFCPDSMCEPVCVKACGSNGCGGSCGSCDIVDGGACNGATFVKCVDGCSHETNCEDKGKICGFGDWLNNGTGGYGCIEPGTGSNDG